MGEINEEYIPSDLKGRSYYVVNTSIVGREKESLIIKEFCQEKSQRHLVARLTKQLEDHKPPIGVLFSSK